jgi:hypothetical protein
MEIVLSLSHMQSGELLLRYLSLFRVENHEPAQLNLISEHKLVTYPRPALSAPRQVIQCGSVDLVRNEGPLVMALPAVEYVPFLVSRGFSLALCHCRLLLLNLIAIFVQGPTIRVSRRGTSKLHVLDV